VLMVTHGVTAPEVEQRAFGDSYVPQVTSL
jgi:hypothetical protein